ncbi:polysaccharide deacetylase family protein [Marinivivus vitaminiproducens]|uniref:polysaccharide deacetylase family protein n=1 Tax=Marinivivus vitaminiproducens TaxID=3035935 RepID=UPI0027A34559|nr:polysaccharide deacetylase family protein [Geminicoccaceae bacterium SCSIO 64248]
MAVLRISSPATLRVERTYVLDVVFRDWLGLDYVLEAEPEASGLTIICMANDQAGRRLVLADDFFACAASHWLMPESLPSLPLAQWDLAADGRFEVDGVAEVPVLFGKLLPNGRYLEIRDKDIRLGLDVFGAIFFMLSRYEEWIVQTRDSHARFPATASVAYRAGFLHRPLANEYLEILWTLLRRLWPQIARRRHAFAVRLTCDVDRPFGAVGKSWPQVFRGALCDLAIRRSPGLMVRRLALRATGCDREDDERKDPNNTFGFIMKTSERHGFTSTFYFMTGQSNPRFDDGYPIRAPRLRRLLRRIHDGGHEIGLHPSYETFRDGTRIQKELSDLLGALEQEGIRLDRCGARQHYLRFDATQTWRHYEAAGLAYDATMSFADHAGFRCGTCYDFQLFDLAARKPLALREQPLIAMEISLLDYQRLSPDEARDAIAGLAGNCRKFSGTFSLLWHNTELRTTGQQRYYESIIAEIARSTPAASTLYGSVTTMCSLAAMV